MTSIENEKPLRKMLERLENVDYIENCLKKYPNDMENSYCVRKMHGKPRQSDE